LYSNKFLAACNDDNDDDDDDDDDVKTIKIMGTKKYGSNTAKKA
jgi:hypothetical protein